MSKTGDVIGTNLLAFGASAKTHGGAAASKIGEEAAKLKEKI